MELFTAPISTLEGEESAKTRSTYEQGRTIILWRVIFGMTSVVVSRDFGRDD